MIRLSTVSGGPLAGLPTISLTLHEGETMPSLEHVAKTIEPYIPPVMHFTLRLENPKSTEALMLVQELLRRSLHVSVEALGRVEPWMLGCSSIFLFTQDHLCKEHAQHIIFLTDEPPVRWRPDPWHLAKGTATYWSCRSVTAERFARLPTGMRLWQFVEIGIEAEDYNDE
jgi:hypothetical protein